MTDYTKFRMISVITWFAILLVPILYSSDNCSPLKSTHPPLARKVPHSYTINDHEFTDDFLWLKNISDPNVEKYINDENAFTNQWFSTPHHISLERKIINELNDVDVKSSYNLCLGLDEFTESFWQDGLYIYWITTAPNAKEIYKRRKIKDVEQCDCFVDLSSDIETVLDLNLIIPGNRYYSIGFFEPNPFNPQLIAYGIDYSGDEQFSLQVLDLSLGMITNITEYAYYSCRWSPSGWVYYNTVSSVYKVPLSISRAGPFLNYTAAQNNLSENRSSIQIQELYTEQDPSLTTELFQTNDKEYLFVKVFLKRLMIGCWTNNN